MSSWIDLLVMSLVVMNLMMLSSSRLRTCIRIVAVQGVVVGLMPLFMAWPALAAGTILASTVTVILKGMVFPRLLTKAQQQANVRKEVEPIGGYPLSLLMGVALFLVSFWLSGRLPYVRPLVSSIVVPVAFATFFTGALVIISRRKALTQVLGYLMLENGIYLFGAAFLVEQSFLVELAILLDIFVAVFVMGIAIFHISREFDHIDTHDLDQLTDWVST